MVETHEGEADNHSGRQDLALKVKGLRHFWPIMLEKCKEYASK